MHTESDRATGPTAHGTATSRRLVAGVVALHLLAALAPLTFTRPGLWAAAGLYLLTGLGISVGHHRLFAHHSFVAARPVRWVLGLLGALAFQGGPIRWCLTHRLHHRHPDRPDDPQRSGAGFWTAHIGWVVTEPAAGGRTEWDHPLVADLRRDPFLRFLEAAHLPLNLAAAGVLFAAGWACGGWPLAASLVVWGVGLRVVALWHSTLLVNSVAHRWGYRNYATRDNSRNVWWLLPVSFGECWHNNHHARPRSAAHGHRWFELDPSSAVIRILGLLGLASRVVGPPVVPRGASRPRC